MSDSLVIFLVLRPDNRDCESLIAQVGSSKNCRMVHVPVVDEKKFRGRYEVQRTQ
jgi:hypothetical protein